MTSKISTLHKVTRLIGPCLCATLIAGTLTCFWHTTASASTLGTSDPEREDKTIGTFTEGMQIGRDEETGDTILRSAPSPTDAQMNQTNGSAEPQAPPAINIQISPRLKQPRPHK